MRVLFMGTPAFAVPSLESLLATGFDVVGVVTQPDRPVGRHAAPAPPAVKVAALAADVPVFQPPTLRTPEARALLNGLTPDVIVVVAFGQILRRSVLDLPPLGCLNVHPSLLPRLRGASPIPAAIREGRTESGVTIMLMNERMDAGPILTQVTAPIFPDDTAATLGDRLAREGARLLTDTLPRWQRAEISPRGQDEASATYCTPLRKEDAEIDWTRSADEIARTCRAQTPWPGCHSFLGGRQVGLLGVEPLLDWSGEDQPGTILRLRSDRSNHIDLVVATGRGALRVHRLQLAGKRPLSADEFVRGRPDLVGAVLKSTASS
jgi:methionyl-tRNA formyltransferase